MERTRQTQFDDAASMRGNGRSAEDPDAIQQDIHRTRERIDETLDAIKHQLSPGDLINQVVHLLRGEGGSDIGSKAGDVLSSLARTVKDNPIPVALIGIGLLGLAKDGDGKSRSLVSQTHGERGVGEGSEQVGEQVQAKAHEAREMLHDKTDHARELLHDKTDQAREKMHEARESIERGYERVRHRIEDDPIVLGALGIALGAALGAGLPRTRIEDEKLGHKRDELAAKAKQVGKQVGEQIRQGVQHAGEQSQGELSQGEQSQGEQPMRSLEG